MSNTNEMYNLNDVNDFVNELVIDRYDNGEGETDDMMMCYIIECEITEIYDNVRYKTILEIIKFLDDEYDQSSKDPLKDYAIYKGNEILNELKDKSQGV